MRAEQDPEVTAPAQTLEMEPYSKEIGASKGLDVGAQVLGEEGIIEYTEEGETSLLWHFRYTDGQPSFTKPK